MNWNNKLINTLFDVSKYERQTQREKAYLIYAIIILILVTGTLSAAFLVNPAFNNTIFNDALAGSQRSQFTVVFFYTTLTITYILTYTGSVNRAGIGIFIIVYGILIGPIITSSGNLVQPSGPIAFSILILIAGLLYRIRGVIIALTICSVTLWINFDTQLLYSLVGLTILIVSFTMILAAYIRLSDTNRAEGVAEEQVERLKLAEITTNLSSLSLGRSSLDIILKRGLDTIQQGYPQFYHAQVFLLDETGRNAQLVSSTGEIGQALLQRQHSIGVGSQSVIGQATLRNTHIISRSNDGGSVHQRNEFLPDTLVEAAFPLQVGTQVIGTLDLQSKLRLELSENDIAIYQSMANSFALAIDNARQFELAEARVEDNQKLAQQAQQALQEVDRLNKRLMEQAWSEYLMSQNDQLGVNVDFENDEIENSETWSETLTRATEDGNIIQTIKNNQRLITIPLKVRGQVVGAMEFEMESDGSIDPNDLTLIQEVSERFGLAAENTRLVEESQRVAQREALINEVGSRLQATNNIESTLTEAVRSLSNILGAQRVSIKLREPNNEESNGSN